MVGNKKSNRGERCYLSNICDTQKCRRISPPRISFPECCYTTLEREPRPDDADAKDQATAEARAEAGFYDTTGSRTVFVVRTTDATSSEVFSDRVVHWEPPRRDNGPKVVDDKS